MNGYICFYDRKRIEVEAETSLEARKKATDEFKPPKSKRHMVSVYLAEKDSVQVVHSTAGI